MLLDASDPWIRWDWTGDHVGLISDDLTQHVELTAIAVGIGCLIALPAGVLVWRTRALRSAVLGTTGALYTIPSLALLALLVPFFGLSYLTAEIALVSYTLQILVRNTVVGLDSVPAEVRQAAAGMGFTQRGRLLRVDLPLALPVIVAGIRVATVNTIALVSVTAVIGEGGLGQLILRGLIQDFKTPIVLGTVLSVLLAIVAAAALIAVQSLLTPWSRSRGGRA